MPFQYCRDMIKDILNITADDSLGNPRAASVRLQARSLRQAYGQRRHDFRNGPQPDYVDSSRSDLNRYLKHPRPLPTIKKEIEVLRKQAGARRAIKSNAAIVTAGIITFGTQAQVLVNSLTADQQDAAFMELAQAIADRFQATLESLSIHCDESAIHAHFEIRGYSDFGQPVSKIATRTVSSELQDMTAEIMARHCPAIERGYKKWDRIAAGAAFSETVNRSVKELHRDLPIEIAAKKEVLLELEARIQDLMNSVERDRGRVAKLEAKEQINAREEERLKDYRNRLDKKKAALVALGVEIDARKASLADMTAAMNAQATDLDRRQIAQDRRALEQDSREQAQVDLSAAVEEREVEVADRMVAVASEAAVVTSRSKALDAHAAFLARQKATQGLRAVEQAERERAQKERSTTLDEREAGIESRILAAASEAAALTMRTIGGIICGEIVRDDSGKWTVTAADGPALKRIWKAILPALMVVHSWWAGAQEKVNALPEPDRDALMNSLTLREDPPDDDALER